MSELVPTRCVDWSLNTDTASGKTFLWHNQYSISIWSDTLGFIRPYDDLDDTAVWKAFMWFGVNTVFKLCVVCRQPDGVEDMMICCYCGRTVHCECSMEATEDQIACKEANCEFVSYLRVCNSCGGVGVTPTPTRGRGGTDARKAIWRALTIRDEYPKNIVEGLELLRGKANAPHTKEEDKRLLSEVRTTVGRFFQPRGTTQLFEKVAREGKGGVGIVAVKDVPAFTIVGVYPGYGDALGGEHAKLGRPIPKYALMDLNCADYFNVVFEEFQDTFTPFINEPDKGEKSNCGWIQETKYRDGRLSVMTCRDVSKGEELLIGYGPVYPRDYPFTYDAFTFYQTKSKRYRVCFALWHWPTVDAKDAVLEHHVEFDEASNSYHLVDFDEV
uniref:WGS project CAEQ00000000 data, annotated contig 1735 n=1 Tax=Trypanosoma congolense (strain IL3000) TaxID=1068625 RepID=F9W8H0_TRYCI|nr:unnamed protein product [Trypanosoma congolense IL3000]